MLHRLFELADELDLREGNPVNRRSRPNWDKHQPAILTDEEYERLLLECSNHPMLNLYVLLLAETGVRAFSEALWLRWEHVDLEGGFLWIDSRERRTKSGNGRWIPTTHRLWDAMREHFARFRFAEYRSEWVFHHLPGLHKGKTKPGERAKSFKGRLRKAVERAGLPDGFRLHDLRHRRATTWLADGKNPVHVKEALGHSDLRVTMDYTHLVRENLVDLRERSSDASEPQTEESVG